jgi:hypothetical protein
LSVLDRGDRREKEVDLVSVSVLFLLLAAGVGGSAECLVYNRAPGAGWTLLVVSVALAVHIVRRRLERRLAPWVIGLWGAAATMAGAMTLYDAEVVRALGPWLCVSILLMATWWSLRDDVPLDAFANPLSGRFLSDVLLSWLQIAPGLREARPGTGPDMASPSACGADPLRGKPAPASRVLYGLLIALPLMILFGALFAAADDMFREVLRRGSELVSEDAAWSAVRLAAFTLLALGLLRCAALRETGATIPGSGGGGGDALVAAVVLGLLNAMFALFLVVQSRYLFGGHALIALPGVTYAEYARHGFFELAAVSTLVLVVVCVTHLLIRDGDRIGAPIFLSVLLTLQTFGVAVSATKRLAMYTDAYGLSVQRVYLAAAMGIICVLLALAAGAAWRRASMPWLGSRMAYTVVILIALLSLFDVEGQVARTNLALAAAGRPLDVDYLASLSSDVLPALREAAGETSEARGAAARAALERWTASHPADDEGWPSLNVSRSRR